MIEEIPSQISSQASSQVSSQASSPLAVDPLFSHEFLKSSRLYSQYSKRNAEIDRHKWFESERAGKDVGIDYAFFDWLLKHSQKWRSDPQS
jgi:hypothetical protein